MLNGETNLKIVITGNKHRSITLAHGSNEIMYVLTV